jgi:ribosome-associated protein
MTPRRRQPPPQPQDQTTEGERPLYSRTEDKRLRERDEQALMDLARSLVDLSAKQLAKLRLPEGVLAVVEDTRRLSHPAARNRSLRLVRTALRGDDADAIRQRLRVVLDPSLAPNDLERWRERLLQEGDEALTAFLEAYPAADRQQLRQLLRNVQKARVEERVTCLRALSKVLRAHLNAAE